MSERDADRAVEAFVTRLTRQFTEGIQWIHKDCPEVLDAAVRDRICRAFAEAFENGFKPFERKPYTGDLWNQGKKK